MRGNCSPLSISKIRVAPMTLFRVTRPSTLRDSLRDSLELALRHDANLPRLIAQKGECFLRRMGADEGDETSFVRHVERVEAEDFTRAAHILADRDGSFIDVNVQPRRLGDFDQRAGEAAARQVAQAVDANPRVEQ